MLVSAVHINAESPWSIGLHMSLLSWTSLPPPGPSYPQSTRSDLPVSHKVCRWQCQNLRTRLGFTGSCFVAKWSLPLGDLMDYSTPGSPVLHCLPEFAQILIYWVSAAVSPSHPLSPSSPQSSRIATGWEGGNPVTDWVREGSQPWDWQVRQSPSDWGKARIHSQWRGTRAQ